MGRNDRRNRHNHKNWNNQNHQHSQNYYEQNKNVQFKSRFIVEDNEENQKREVAIREFKSKTVTCSKCGQVITELASSISDADGNPIHFDCVLESIKSNEKLLPGQQVTYIGNGRFAVVSFENPRELKKFKIEKIIEYEDKSKTVSWREEMANLYSQVK